jgi:hypothetical protein
MYANNNEEINIKDVNPVEPKSESKSEPKSEPEPKPTPEPEPAPLNWEARYMLYDEN